MSSASLGTLLLCAVVTTGCGESFTNIKHPPKGGTKDFTTGSAKYPPSQPGYAQSVAHPSAKKWGDPVDPAAPQAGYDFMLEHVPPAVVAGKVIVQRLVISGITFRTRNQCGDFPVPIAGVISPEYFRSTPANDVLARFTDSELMVMENRAGTVAYFALPGTPPAVPANENAATLDDAYLRSLSQAQKVALDGELNSTAVISRWRYFYEYDGCHGATPTTSCGDKHCLRHTAESVGAGGAVTGTGTSTFQGAGKQW